MDAIGLGFSGATLVGKTPVIVNMRTYREFNADNHFEGNVCDCALLSGIDCSRRVSVT